MHSRCTHYIAWASPFLHCSGVGIVIHTTDPMGGLTFPSFRVALCALLLLVSLRHAVVAEPITTLPSAAAPSASANSDSTLPILSADGNLVLFTSQASNLATNDNNGLLLDVFLRNLTNGATLLLSVTPEGTASGNGTSIGVGISSNNQFVV